MTVRGPQRWRGLVLAAGLLAGRLSAQTVEELAADPTRWPAEVTLKAATKATVLRDGKPAGMILLGAGKKLTVAGVAADGVTGKVGGTTVKVPVEKTNLLPDAPAAGPVAAPAPRPVLESAPDKASPFDAPKADLAEVMGDAGQVSPMQRLFAGKLVRYTGGELQKVDAARLARVKFYGLYFSAGWCGPCRQFTPDFVTAYRELKRAHPEFEVIFLSGDNSAADMQNYMAEDRMPWPAVGYDQREEKMMAYGGPGIPCLVLVDATGKVLADSFRGGDYLGPQHVLAETRRILQRGY